jgi:endoglucanase
MSGIEIIQHGIRTATNYGVRLNATPVQWGPIPQFVERKISREENFKEQPQKEEIHSDKEIAAFHF